MHDSTVENVTIGKASWKVAWFLNVTWLDQATLFEAEIITTFYTVLLVHERYEFAFDYGNEALQIIMHSQVSPTPPRQSSA